VPNSFIPLFDLVDISCDKINSIKYSS